MPGRRAQPDGAPTGRAATLSVVQRVPVLIGSVAAAALLVGAVALDRQRTETPEVEVIFGDDNGLPETLTEGSS